MEAATAPKLLSLFSTRIFLDILFFSLLSVLIFEVAISEPYTLPLSFFILSIAMSCVLVVDIFSAEGMNRTKIVLTKIILFALFLRLAPLYKFPHTGSDIFYHTYVVNGIIREAHNFLSAGHMYSDFLGMHYIVIATEIVTGLGVENSMKTIVFLEVLGLLFLFLVAKSIFNEKIGLLSALLSGIDCQHIYWGLNIIPMSLGLTITIMLIYLIIKFDISGKTAFKALTLALMLLLVYTHTLSSGIFSILLIAMYLGTILHPMIFKKGLLLSVRSLKASIPAYFGVVMVSYWMYCSGFFLEFAKIFSYVLSVDLLQLRIAVPPETPDIFCMLEDISFILFVIPTMIGTFYCLKHKRDMRSQMLISSGFVLALIVNLNQYSRLYTDAIIPYRWWSFIFITIAPLSALGILLMYNAIRKNSVKFLMLIFTIMVLTSSNLVTVLLVPDNPVFKPDRDVSLNDFEVGASNTFLRHYEGKIVSDDTYNWYITNTHRNEVEELYRYIRLEDLLYVDGVVLIRDFIFHHPMVVSYEKKEGGYAGYRICLNESQINMIVSMGNKYNKIYDNEKVTAYLKGEDD
ncbi:MAG: hypothetical protein A7315_09165 [Candidatus Altiarchaeales archaeon WOR_SM1_79]|nr:MAG: hypothetical protein A7315_09165 [Candidatus Altiarchaeales archaeon WOR_SM1_79]